MKVLVTGGAGRLGFHVVETLSERGYSVRVLDLPGVNWRILDRIENLEIYEGDVIDAGCVRKACRDAEAVIHLAAILPPLSEKNHDATIKVNVEGTANILKFSKSNVRIVFASSVSTYGVTSEESRLIQEEDPLIPHNSYSESKILAEKALKSSGNPFSILRVAPISVVDLVELPETVPYRGDQRVEFVYVKDAAVAMVNALKHKKNESYIIAGGETWQMRGKEYIDRFYGALGVEVEPSFSTVYTAVDWYDTRKSRILNYQRTSFIEYEEKLQVLGEELGFR